MASGLSKAERETIISFGELDSTANIYSTSPSMVSKIKALGGKQDGLGYSVDVPKAWIKISKPRAVSTAARAKAKSNMAKINKRKKG